MLPQVVQVAIGAAVTFLVVLGLQWLSTRMGHPEWSTQATVIALALTSVVIFGINTILALIVQLDPNAQKTIDLVLMILAAILSSMGFGQLEYRFTRALTRAMTAALKSNNP